MTPSIRQALVESVVARRVEVVTVSEMIHVYAESAKLYFSQFEDSRLKDYVEQEFPDLYEIYLKEPETSETTTNPSE